MADNWVNVQSDRDFGDDEDDVAPPRRPFDPSKLHESPLSTILPAIVPNEAPPPRSRPPAHFSPRAGLLFAHNLAASSLAAPSATPPLAAAAVPRSRSTSRLSDTDSAFYHSVSAAATIRQLPLPAYLASPAMARDDEDDDRGRSRPLHRTTSRSRIPMPDPTPAISSPPDTDEELALTPELPVRAALPTPRPTATEFDDRSNTSAFLEFCAANTSSISYSSSLSDSLLSIGSAQDGTGRTLSPVLRASAPFDLDDTSILTDPDLTIPIFVNPLDHADADAEAAAAIPVPPSPHRSHPCRASRYGLDGSRELGASAEFEMVDGPASGSLAMLGSHIRPRPAPPGYAVASPSSAVMAGLVHGLESSRAIASPNTTFDDAASTPPGSCDQSRCDSTDLLNPHFSPTVSTLSTFPASAEGLDRDHAAAPAAAAAHGASSRAASRNSDYDYDYHLAGSSHSHYASSIHRAATPPLIFDDTPAAPSAATPPLLDDLDSPPPPCHRYGPQTTSTTAAAPAMPAMLASPAPSFGEQTGVSEPASLASSTATVRAGDHDYNRDHDRYLAAHTSALSSSSTSSFDDLTTPTGARSPVSDHERDLITPVPDHARDQVTPVPGDRYPQQLRGSRSPLTDGLGFYMGARDHEYSPPSSPIIRSRPTPAYGVPPVVSPARSIASSSSSVATLRARPRRAQPMVDDSLSSLFPLPLAPAVSAPVAPSVVSAVAPSVVDAQQAAETPESLVSSLNWQRRVYLVSPTAAATPASTASSIASSFVWSASAAALWAVWRMVCITFKFLRLLVIFSVVAGLSIFCFNLFYNVKACSASRGHILWEFPEWGFPSYACHTTLDTIKPVVDVARSFAFAVNFHVPNDRLYGYQAELEQIGRQIRDARNGEVRRNEKETAAREAGVKREKSSIWGVWWRPFGLAAPGTGPDGHGHGHGHGPQLPTPPASKDAPPATMAELEARLAKGNLEYAKNKELLTGDVEQIAGLIEDAAVAVRVADKAMLNLERGIDTFRVSLRIKLKAILKVLDFAGDQHTVLSVLFESGREATAALELRGEELRYTIEEQLLRLRNLAAAAHEAVGDADSKVNLVITHVNSALMKLQKSDVAAEVEVLLRERRRKECHDAAAGAECEDGVASEHGDDRPIHGERVRNLLSMLLTFPAKDGSGGASGSSSTSWDDMDDAARAKVTAEQWHRQKIEGLLTKLAKRTQIMLNNIGKLFQDLDEFEVQLAEAYHQARDAAKKRNESNNMIDVLRRGTGSRASSLATFGTTTLDIEEEIHEVLNFIAHGPAASASSSKGSPSTRARSDARQKQQQQQQQQQQKVVTLEQPRVPPQQDAAVLA
ncbi:hypothetical protein H9P43_008217 [Blastocladiella emersonii ATCC 22665]|nr:hypothetical protein H9P43_008217 [Blastocladiella emersonii ATCC 22665]